MVEKNHQGVIINLKVVPNSSCFKIEEFDAAKNELRVKVCSPPEKGKANKELLKKLQKVFDSKVEIIKGEKSNKKKVLVQASEKKMAAVLEHKNRL